MLISGVIISLILVIIYSVFRKYHGQNTVKKTASTMIVIGSGGHTSEMLQLVESLDHHYQPRIYIMANTDVMSEKKVILLEEKLKQKFPSSNHVIVKIPRAREVHQSWVSTILTTLYSALCSVPIILKWKPDIMLCNGPGTCVPIAAIGFVFKMLRILYVKIIYVESICRVYDLSMSGKLLYRFSDYLLVQWPELLVKYPKATYLGRLSG